MPVVLVPTAPQDIALEDLMALVLPRANGCPSVVAEAAVRSAVIELCQKALIWREYQSPILTVADQTLYRYAPAEGQLVFKLLSATLNGEAVPMADPSTGKSRDSAGESSTYVYGSYGSFELRPAQAADMEIVTYSVVQPTQAVQALPPQFGNYAEQIARGALSRLLKVKDRAWTDKQEAANLHAEWLFDVSCAQSDAMRGFARTTPRTVPRFF